MSLRGYMLQLEDRIFSKECVNVPAQGGKKGIVLMGYLNRPVLLKENHRRLLGHTNRWESREIALTFSRLGYDVDVIDLNNHDFKPSKNYSIHFDTNTNIVRLHSLLPDSLQLLHCTGSYPGFSNAAEIKRALELKDRTGVEYAPKRQVPHVDAFDRSMDLADRISLIGNRITLSTYPERLHRKIVLTAVTAPKTYIKPSTSLAPQKREFLWFGGFGAVHKGLDLTLEAFRKLPDTVLHVVGNAKNEQDFMNAYGDDLLHRSNIRYHGYLMPDSDRFAEIIDRCCCFISPSCSEGISTASAAAMQAGLYPIISRNNGIDLPQGCGMYLERCSIEDIAQGVEKVIEMPQTELHDQIQKCQSEAITRFSRSNFTRTISSYISTSIEKGKDG